MVLSNLDGTDLPEALMYYLYDLYHAAREGLYRRLPRRLPKARGLGRQVPAPPGGASATLAASGGGGLIRGPRQRDVIAHYRTLEP